MTLPQLDGPRAAPASGEAAKQLVILLHGYGSDGNDLIGLAPHLQKVLPDAAFVSPNAPQRCDMNPGGYQWFPLTRIDPGEVWRGVNTAAPILDAFIDRELERHGLTPDKLALVGFSQGTMMSLHVGLRRDQQIGGILGFSGALAGPEHLIGEIKSRPPVLLVHGSADMTVPIAMLPLAVQTLSSAGVKVLSHVSPGIAHSIGPDGMAKGQQFLNGLFQGSHAAAQ